MPPPPAITKPSRLVSYGREADAGVSLWLLESAPIASNSTVMPQCSSSPPPANITSCTPWRIMSAAAPMQCAEVAQAAEIE